MIRRMRLLLILLASMSWRVLAQSTDLYQTDFPPEEFQARWAKIFDAIGDKAVAIVQGAPQVTGFIYPRQYNEFYYLCGIETPYSYFVLDGRTRKTMLLLPPRNARLEQAEGKTLSAADADLVIRLTGVDTVASTDAMRGEWFGSLFTGRSVVIYTPFQPPEGYAESRGELLGSEAGIASDYWDGRIPRHTHFVQLLHTRFPRTEIRDLSPILDELRVIKSPREIALIRRASQLAGLGTMEGIRSTEPGVYEYQLDAAARYIFLVNGARLDAYRSIVGAGTANIWNMHYYRNTKKLEDGELVLMDYAPDYHYYVSDLGRVFPVNGKYSKVQRELLGFVLEYFKAVKTRIRPGVTAKQIMDEAAVAMEDVFKRTKFSKPIYEQAAHRLVETGGGVFSHTVGMAVHDVGSYRNDLLKPGLVFAVDPQLRVPEENIYLRYETTVVVTETGVEDFTSFLPIELDDLEKLVREKGVVQKVPPQPTVK
jgi:Xaa-Pro aminopeptidase